ncbi:MAG: site-specific DNA-methyltransferase, partial [Methanoregula sp.]|nr:site-specific DNA-methyltransferase [Methanoregula sp.]
MEHSLGAFDYDTIYLGDALELMPAIPDGVVNLIITDPPFAIDFKAEKENYNRTSSRVLQGYREILESDYSEFTHRWMTDAARVLAPDGSMYVFSGWNHLRDILEGLDEAGLTTVNHLIWKYQFGVFTKKKYVTSHYHILFVVKNPARYTFNKIDHYPEDVWVISREYWKGKKKTPTKLPPEIVIKMLKYSSNPGDLVFDPFLGSGTVAVGAKSESRHFLGFEIV